MRPFYFLSFFCFVFFCEVSSLNWPIPYERVPLRPQNDPFCQAGLMAFCPTGKTVDSMPVMQPDDKIEVYALKKPVWSFKLGPLLGYFKIMHDGLGFKNLRTGLNYTMEWYELDQLFNCTFPHVVNNDSLTWCNQGALCVYDGIDDKVWAEYGFVEKISQVSGDTFNKFANWSTYDNNTAIYYETWTVFSDDIDKNKNAVMYFDSFDCASWVLRALDQLHNFGAEFDSSVHINYTRLNLYGDEPQLLGNYSTIFSGKYEALKNDILDFYRDFQKPVHYIEQLFKIYNELVVQKKFYFYYNSLYWFIPLKSPYIKVTYDEIPLPGTKNALN